MTSVGLDSRDPDASSHAIEPQETSQSADCHLTQPCTREHSTVDSNEAQRDCDTSDSATLNIGVDDALVEELRDKQALADGWQRVPPHRSLEEYHASVPMPPPTAPWYSQAMAFLGLGFVVSVGYMDPGNWATGLAAGAGFGYALLCAVLLASITAMFLQALSIKLGVVAERDLAQACKDAYSRPFSFLLWISAEVAIIATDLAEVIGGATAFHLLFGLPLWVGVLLTSITAILLLALSSSSVRFLELAVALLCALITACFAYELAIAPVDWPQVFIGYVPSALVFTNTGALYAAVGILGATVMPHNLYLHSSLIQTRGYERTKIGKKVALRYGTIDSCLSLSIALFVNSAIVILSAAAFHATYSYVEDISEAYALLAPALGQTAARIIFGVGLLASGQNSTITGTLAGQVVMEGFLHLKVSPFIRRTITRLIALVPAIIASVVGGPGATGRLLVLSQVILSMQLPFCVIPLVHFTSSRTRMGNNVNSWPTFIIACFLSTVIVGLNIFLIISAIKGA